MATKRYPSQSKTRAQIMEERLAKGLCDSCGGETAEFPIAGRRAVICANQNAGHGFHEVGKRDGAPFSSGYPPANPLS